MPRDRLLIDLGPPSAWWLDAVTRIDEQAPGFAGAALRASNARKLVIGAYLAQTSRSSGRPKGKNAGDAADLLRKRHKHLLEDAFGSCPPGFRSALIRLTCIPTDRQIFSDLHRIFSDKKDRSIARVLMQCGRLIPRKIELCTKLPRVFRRPWLIKKYVGGDHEELLTVLGMAKVLRPDLSEADLRAHAKWLERSGSLPKLLHTLINKAELPADPVAIGGVARHVESVRELNRVGRQFRNCVGTYVFDALGGRSHFYVCNVGQEQAVAHVQQLAGRNEYVLSHLEAPKGDRLSRRADQAIEAAFRVRCVQRNVCGGSRDPWWIIERVFGRLSAEIELDAITSEWDALQIDDVADEAPASP